MRKASATNMAGKFEVCIANIQRGLQVGKR